jgi:hypothetical protein
LDAVQRLSQFIRIASEIAQLTKANSRKTLAAKSYAMFFSLGFLRDDLLTDDGDRVLSGVELVRSRRNGRNPSGFGSRHEEGIPASTADD